MDIKFKFSGEARDIYREECADFWIQVNDMYWGG